MPIEQMNISLPPEMARFIRGKVEAGDYTIRHMQEIDAAKKSRGHAQPNPLTSEEQQRVKQSVQRGVKDFEEGRFTEFDEAGLHRHFADIGKRGKKRLASVSGQQQA